MIEVILILDNHDKLVFFEDPIILINDEGRTHSFFPHLHQIPLAVKLIGCLDEIPGNSKSKSQLQNYKIPHLHPTSHPSTGVPCPLSGQLGRCFQRIRSTTSTDQPGLVYLGVVAVFIATGSS